MWYISSTPKVEYRMTPQARELETSSMNWGTGQAAGSYHNYKRLNSNNIIVQDGREKSLLILAFRSRNRESSCVLNF